MERKMLPVRRFGLCPDMAVAQDYAHRLAGDGTNVTHVVEVYDEERGTVPDSDRGQAGVIYVVEDKHLEEFRQEHDDLQIIDTYGHNPKEGH